MKSTHKIKLLFGAWHGRGWKHLFRLPFDLYEFWEAFIGVFSNLVALVIAILVILLWPIIVSYRIFRDVKHVLLYKGDDLEEKLNKHKENKF